LDGQLNRARRLFELGEYDEETFLLKRAEIRAEQERIRQEAATSDSQNNLDWCRLQIFNLVSAWDAADGAQHTRLLNGLWTYLNTPFLYTWPGFVTEQIAPSRSTVTHGGG
jgi:hypothetical protein